VRHFLRYSFCLLLILTAGTATATIDWAGNLWPVQGTFFSPDNPLDLYAQVYKAGVTDSPGQGADITAVLYYTTDIAPQASLAMSYNTDVGNNDEYTGQIPQTALQGAAWVDVTVIFTDQSDGTDYEIAGDQGGNPPPVRYLVEDQNPDLLEEDKEVCFQVCMIGIENSGDVCVTGSLPQLTEWGTGVVMVEVGTGLYQACIVVPAGTPLPIDYLYKFRKDDCTTWESSANRSGSLDNNSPPSQTYADMWDGFGLGPCEPVGAEEATWGNLKGMYR
jgi:hypothetical protein